jgi:hypothetical protein
VSQPKRSPVLRALSARSLPKFANKTKCVIKIQTSEE